MDHQKYIDKAVNLAAENVEKGGKPFGAVIVNSGNIITTGVNEVVQCRDITTHAEIQAIRKASSAGKMLEGSTLYASGHPCPMCLSAIYLAGIKKVYYASGLDDAEEAGLGVSHVYNELKKDWDAQSILLKQLKSSSEKDPMKMWQER